MAEIWYDVDSALAEVPVNILPLLDSTDFKTIEDAVAYNAAGLALFWHFVTTAGAYTVTAVTPTTGGDYDWTDQGTSGVYTIEIPAAGGASINNDTEGFGWFTGVATGVLPWRSPVYGFRAAGLNNALIDSAYSATRGLAGTALPDAAADAAGGLPISDAGGLDLDAKVGALTFTVANKVDANATHISGDSTAADNAEAFFDGTGYAGTNNVIPTVTAVTNGVTLANGAHGGAAATLTLGGAGGMTATVTGNLTGSVASVTGAVGSVTGAVGSVTGAVGSVTGAVGSVTGAVGSMADNGASLSAVPWNSAWDAEVQSECADAIGAFTIADADTLTADSIPYWLRRLCWYVMEKLDLTDATGAYSLKKRDGTTAVATGTVSDNSTTTTRSAPTWL